jgi:uncharacterized protein DUF2625
VKSLYELVDTVDPAWPLIQGWIAASDRPIEVLPANRARGEATLLALQVTTHSALGALALESGGVFVDHGWLRLLGSGSQRMRGDLCSWNGLDGPDDTTPLKDALIVAHDAIGGFFAVNGGAWTEGELGSVHYLAPDSLKWESLDLGYTDFMRWAFLGDLAGFYQASRWPSWREDSASVDGDYGFLIMPPLWSSGPPLAERVRRAAPQRELLAFALDVGRQTQDLPPGAHIQLRVDSSKNTP